MLHTILAYGAYLICPLMMVFCMKGMFGKNKSCSLEKPKQPQFSTKREELEYVRNQMNDLEARYQRLAAEEEQGQQPTVLSNKETVHRV